MPHCCGILPLASPTLGRFKFDAVGTGRAHDYTACNSNSQKTWTNFKAKFAKLIISVKSLHDLLQQLFARHTVPCFTGPADSRLGAIYHIVDVYASS